MKLITFVSALVAVSECCVPTYRPDAERCSCGVPLNKRRIIEGRPALESEYPWMVALIDPHTGLQVCGASLLSSTTVLTAAHCIRARDIIVAIPNGDTTLENATKIETSNILIHPNHDAGGPAAGFDYDFAIITLPIPVEFTDTTMPICLPDPNDMFEDNAAIATGWGLTSPPPLGKPSPILLTVNTTTMSNKQCEATLASTYVLFGIPPQQIPGAITSNMICAGRSSCNGDSGGPLITLSKDGSYFSQIGVVGWGVNCNYPPVMYSRVTAQLYWIIRQITGDTCSPPMNQ